MRNLLDLICQLEENIVKLEKLNTKISSQNIGWHIEHSLLTIELITSVLEKSNPKDLKHKISLSYFLIIKLGFPIPKGKGKAPQVVLPTSFINIESLTKHIVEVKQKIKVLDSLQKKQFFNHPVFKHIPKKDAIKFICIHTKHHLKIIEQIAGI